MKAIDLAFSEDGDLLLGAPRIDKDGNILYLQPDGSITTEKGSGSILYDFALSRDLDALKQNIINRLKTDMPDWYHHPQMGSNLSDLIGEPNTREVGERGASFIFKALTYEGLIHPNFLKVRPVPTSENEILFMISISMGTSEPYQLPIVFNLERGLKEV